jgi:glycerophosphoryl diester phosphodiesterase
MEKTSCLNGKLLIIFWMLAGVLSGLCLGGQMVCAGEKVKETRLPYWKGKYPVMVIAHRGFSGRAPENTLASFRRAMEIGSDMIELDVQLSQDGKVVILHDDTLERTTNGRGRVADFTLAELKQLDAGSWFGPRFSGQRIPTLNEVLELAKGRILVNIEIKNPTHGQYPITELCDRALQETRRAGMVNRVIFSSFNPVALERIREKDPRIWVALLYHKPWNSLLEITRHSEYPVLNLRHSYLTKNKIGKIHQEGRKLNVYTLNSEEELERFVSWEVDGIITNDPDRLLKILQGKYP